MKKFFLWQLCSKVLRILFCIALACILALTVIQEDPWIKHAATHAVEKFASTMYDCAVCARVEKISLLRGKFTVKNVRCYDHQKQWSCAANSLSFAWSWRGIFFDKVCRIAVIIDQLTTQTHVVTDQGGVTFALTTFLKKLLAPSNFFIPCQFIHYNFSDCSLRLDHESGSAEGYYDATITVKNNQTQCALSLRQGQLWYTHKKILELPSGTLRCCLEPNKPLVLEADCLVQQTHLPLALQKSTITTELHNNTLFVTTFYENQSLQSSWILKDMRFLYGTAQLPFALLAKMPGIAQLTLSADLNNFMPTCNARVEAINLPFSTNCTGALAFNKAGNPAGAWVIQCPELATSCKGSLVYEGTTVHCSFTKLGDGLEEEPLGSCSISSDQTFTASIPYAAVMPLAKKYGIDLHGEKDIVSQGSWDSSSITAHLLLKDMSLRVPGTYSIMQTIETTLSLDWQKKIISCLNTLMHFYKGQLRCSRATLGYDTKGTITYVHAPLLLHDYFLSWKKELFAQINAGIVFEYTRDRSSLSGTCTLEQSYIHGNILSPEFQQEMFGNQMTHGTPAWLSQQPLTWYDQLKLNLTLLTKSPLEVQTPFLQALLHAHFHVGGTFADKDITGSLNFLQGTLQFPYKPLVITKGSLLFRNSQLDDPLITLTASALLQKHKVELAINGSILNPYITLSADPHLDQEHIITLLLSGNKDGILYLAMPSMLTNSLEHLLFGPAETASKAQRYLKNLLKPLKNFHLVPSLTNQEGRGGLRGSIAFEVTDRLKARFDKNFSLTEDSTFEVEYLFSDDSSVRIIRDERGDIGVEGEKRWKF